MIEGRSLIVSMTTIPSRLINIDSTLVSILGQSLSPDEIVIALPLESKRESQDGDPYNIPNFIEELGNNDKNIKITILRCKKDHGPLTKILPCIRREKDKQLPKDKESLIVSIDDDKIYDKHMIEYLIAGWRRNPNCAIARKGSILKVLDQRSDIYKKHKKMWDKRERIREYVVIGHRLKQDQSISVVFGTSGVVYRPSFFKNDFFNYKFKKGAPSFFHVDDIYISGYLGLKKVVKKAITFPPTRFIKKMVAVQKDNGNLSIDMNNKNREVNPLININSSDVDNSIKCVSYFKKHLVFK